MAFSAEENAAIRETLLREARRCAVTLGLRKTSVEQLTEAAGISKGLFYKYFASKELLFFEVLEDIHSEVYQVAEQALEEGKDLPPDERIANVLLTACSRLSEIGAMKFIEEDSAYLLRRIPAQVKAEHYHSDEVHIRDLLEESGLTPRGGIALAAATIRGLILTVSHQEQIGALYPQVLDPLALGVCDLAVVGVVMLMLSVFLETPALPDTAKVWAAALFLGIVCSGVCLVIQSVYQKHTTASRASLIFTLEPVFSAIFAFFLLGERIGVKGYIGSALMLASLVLVEVDVGALFKKSGKEAKETE